MSIQLDTPRAGGIPVVKRSALGEIFIGAVANKENRPRTRQVNGVNCHIGKDGVTYPVGQVPAGVAIKNEMVVTCVTMPGTTATAGIGDTIGVPAPGDIVRLILPGRSYADWIEACRAHGPLVVGDVVTQTTDNAQAYSSTGSTDGPPITRQEDLDRARARGRTVGVYGTLTITANTDPGWIARATAAHHAATAVVLDTGYTDDAF